MSHCQQCLQYNVSISPSFFKAQAHFACLAQQVMVWANGMVVCAGARLGLIERLVRNLDYILIVNVAVNFCRAYVNSKGSLVYNLPAIRSHYLSTNFVLDLIPCLPLYQVCSNEGSSTFHIAGQRPTPCKKLCCLIASKSCTSTRPRLTCQAIKELAQVLSSKRQLLACGTFRLHHIALADCQAILHCVPQQGGLAAPSQASLHMAPDIVVAAEAGTLHACSCAMSLHCISCKSALRLSRCIELYCASSHKLLRPKSAASFS